MKCYFVYLLSLHLSIIKLGGKRGNLTGKGKASPCLLSFYAGKLPNTAMMYSGKVEKSFEQKNFQWRKRFTGVYQ